MPFAECIFLATNEPEKGCVVKSVYPREVANVLNPQFLNVLFPSGCNMKDAVHVIVCS